ncbi:MAG: 1,2-phenylacetyl-CoA epoxidase subunit B [Melioribacteraceae bacterium]|nr:1,2-phenylacetyl-CoA epoxidase subunit B [Melioribacteraceae bacterium]MCF8354886.1 1,2-phenylacetyl-CoA epoxidase subunit B [Melioribacteraceae bacterium]MCF8393892.1 1,2-phenylacetyl-CoA epoxidase subunit B [Melioribacteraceae bacterium]MCF8419664.1 1,2-phenylacetyl-CoA epoxidase subunit B [Melioribacteraceae bacterium]
MSENGKPGTQWSSWEVFVQAKSGDPHVHVGNVHAPDGELAIQNARDVYTRRNEGISLWVVPSENIIATSPSDSGPFFDPANDKIFRHTKFYSTPKGVRGV